MEELLIAVAVVVWAILTWAVTTILRMACPGVVGGGAEPHLPIIKYYKDIPHREPYTADRAAKKCAALHNGQVKLFLTELQFLTECLARPDTPAIVVYAGSAPSNKIAYLAELFPAVKFVLVDPNEHFVKYGRGENQYSAA